jgi:hypothetical protein
MTANIQTFTAAADVEGVGADHDAEAVQAAVTRAEEWANGWLDDMRKAMADVRVSAQTLYNAERNIYVHVITIVVDEDDVAES